MAGRRDALIIATGTYEDEGLRRLRSPAQDAAALTGVLGDPAIGGFDVTQVVDGTESALRRTLHRFFANRSLDDLLLVHLSCHGIKDDDGRLYFAATDTTREDLRVSAVPSAFLNEEMDACRARSIVLLLDCCYAGAFAPGSKGDTGVHLKEKLEGQGRAILTASNAIEYAWEGEQLSGDGTPSVFTAAVVEGLATGAADRDGDGRVSIHELHEHVTERMLQAVPRQTPLKWELGIEGGLYIARSPRPAGALPAELLAALEHPLASVRAAVVGDLAALVDGTDARASRAAREALGRLLQDDSRSVREAASAALEEEPVGWSAVEPPTPAVRSREAQASPAPERQQASPAPEREQAGPPADPEPLVSGWLGPSSGRWASPRRRAVPRAAVAAGVVAAALVVLGLVLPSLLDRPTSDEAAADVREFTVVVPATDEWTDTGIDLGIGDAVEIEAGGEIRDDINSFPDPTFTPDGEPDPEGEHPGDPHREFNHAALIGRVGSSDVFFVGRERAFTAETAGRLHLGINDGRFDDNDGEFEAVIFVADGTADS